MKLVISLILIVLLCVTVYSAISEGTASPIKIEKRAGVQRISNYEPRLNLPSINQFVPLEATYETTTYGVGRGGRSSINARGWARLKSTMDYGQPSTVISMKTKDLPSTARVKGIFEVWLVDDNTNYRLSLGTFTTQEGGVTQFTYTADYYINFYDYIEITLEPMQDTDTEPGQLLLYGRIEPQSSNALAPYKLW